MKTITHEGQEYILKEDVDGLVRERLSKVTEAKRQAESRANLLESQIHDMESKVKNSEAMASQLAQLQDELLLSNERYERHSAIAGHGITNAEIRDLVEYQFNKAMEGKSKKDRVSLSVWLGNIKETGEIPMVLKPFLGEVSSPAQGQPIAQPQGQPIAQPQGQPIAQQSAPSSTPAQLQALAQTQRPTSNQGVQQMSDHATNGDMIKRAHDYEFFRANRQEVKKRYYQMRQKNRR
jgi:hypothetical protein